MDVKSGLTGTRNLSPLRSLGSLIGLLLVVIWRKPLSHILSKATKPRVLICWRTYAPRSPSTAAQTPSKLANAKAMLLMDETGMRLASGDPTVKMSSAPDRTWLNISVLPPSWLFGKIFMSTRPLVAARMASHASEARLLIGCAAGRSLPYFKLNSPARARCPTTLTPASALAPDSMVRRVTLCIAFLPHLVGLILAISQTLVTSDCVRKFFCQHESWEYCFAARHINHLRSTAMRTPPTHARPHRRRHNDLPPLPCDTSQRSCDIGSDVLRQAREKAQRPILRRRFQVRKANSNGRRAP